MSLNTISLSSNYPNTGNLIFQENFRVDSSEPFIFDLTNIENNNGSNLTVSKIEANFGDGVREFYEPSLQLEDGSFVFKSLSSISHLYSSSLSSVNNNLSGNLIFSYKNGYTTTFRLGIKYIERNIIEDELKFVNSSLFTNKLSSNAVLNFINKDNNFYNLILNSKGFSKETGIEQAEFLNFEKELNKELLVGDRNFKIKSKVNEISEAIILNKQNKLVDEFQKADAAYSLRDIGVGNGPVVEVQRLGDGAKRNFTVNELENRFIETWTTAGGPNLSGNFEAVVRTWYDQTGNGHHATANRTDFKDTTVNPIVPSDKFRNGPSAPFIVKDGTYIGGLSAGDVTTKVPLADKAAAGDSTTTQGMNVFSLSQRDLGRKYAFVVVAEVHKGPYQLVGSGKSFSIGHASGVQTFNGNGSLGVSNVINNSEQLEIRGANERFSNPQAPVFVGSKEVATATGATTTYSTDNEKQIDRVGIDYGITSIQITGFDADNKIFYNKFNGNDLQNVEFPDYPFVRGKRNQNNINSSLGLMKSAWNLGNGYFRTQFNGVFKEVLIYIDKDLRDDANELSQSINEYYSFY